MNTGSALGVRTMGLGQRSNRVNDYTKQPEGSKASRLPKFVQHFLGMTDRNVARQQAERLCAV